MAAFSYQELPPFLVDCVLTPDMMIKLSSSSSSSSSSSTTTSPVLSPSCCFSGDQQQTHLLNPNSSYSVPIFHGEHLQFQYPFDNLVNFHQDQLIPTDFSLHETSCVEQSTPMALPHSTPASSDNETPLTLNGGGDGGDGTQNWTPVTVSNKRKPKGDGSSPNPSKNVRGGRSKKQKKVNNEGVKEEEQEKEKSKAPPPPHLPCQEAPKGYIHVRARRGQATDSHSLAERVRREKISERMKLLQALVPGCDKVTGKATMLDEIINYVQSLQSQVEFLSMKLSSLSPMMYSFGVDLDALLLGQQALSNTAPPLPSLQQCSQSTTDTPPTALAAAAATTGIAAVFQQQGERGSNPPPCLQDNGIGSLYWGVGGQGGPDPIINQPGFGNSNMMY